MEHVKHWRRELRAKIRSMAAEKLIESGSDGNIGALKSLITEDFVFHSFVDSEELKERKRVGRPTKDAPDNSIPDSVLNDDAARIGV